MHFVKFSFALCLLVYCAVCTLAQTTKKPFLEDINENDPAAVEALRAGITKLIDGSEKKAEFYRNLTAVSAKRKELAGITMYIFGIRLLIGVCFVPIDGILGILPYQFPERENLFLSGRVLLEELFHPTTNLSFAVILRYPE
ncbi:uncharacterized protein LOC103510801 [Diaphorina citri]|uniref:Uncharacterized protein LOC103510801 n=1 Tax=Diaphorina citri TaxID=121845 RepID=A0A1S3D3N8_DIACI|nr:uncharacterized protein LOC103510801 [Diaphorina citri]